MRGLLILAAIVLSGCMSTTSVSTKQATVEPREIFWAKNTLAEQTVDPGAAQFRNIFVADLSNGDRVYCGEMNAANGVGGYLGFTPFYMRRSGEAVKALNWEARSADFSAEKCADARAGALRINKV
ncbi:hypothetical protein ACS3QZ_09650 [Shimia sp. W99]